MTTEDDDAKVTRSITLPRSVWDQLRFKAGLNDRTLNGEIACRLKRSLDLDETENG